MEEMLSLFIVLRIFLHFSFGDASSSSSMEDDKFFKNSWNVFNSSFRFSKMKMSSFEL